MSFQFNNNNNHCSSCQNLFSQQKLNLKPIIELDNETYFTNQRFCQFKTYQTIYIHMHTHRAVERPLWDVI